MNRTFHRRLTILSAAGILLTAALALCFFWQRSGPNVIIGVCAVLLTVLQIERLIHTTYTFTTDNLFIHNQGRFSRERQVRVSDIWRVERHTHLFGLMRYLLVTYGPQRHLVVQPDQEEAFLNELAKRQAKENLPIHNPK